MVTLSLMMIFFIPNVLAADASWIIVTSISSAPGRFQTEVIDGIIYAIGRKNDLSYFTSVEAYNLSTNPWTALACQLVVPNFKL